MTHELSASSLEQFSTFGDLLRFLRRRASLTQMELATAVGYSDAQISRLEQNLRLPDIPTVQARFAPALGIENEARAVARLVELAAFVRREDAPALGSCPYKGLSNFEESDAELFVGREELTASLLRRLLELAAGGPGVDRPFLGIVGASGSGKSSLLRAGLLPAIRWNPDSAGWQIRVLTPGVHPIESLAISLTEDLGSTAVTATLMDDLQREPRSLQLLARRMLGQDRTGRVLVAVDQLEELFSLCRSEEERAAFINCLLASAGEGGGSVVILATLRADFYSHCAAYPALRQALARSQEFIGAMSEDELRRAIEEPAKRARWDLEPGLVQLLLQDVGREPGALPLLSHALLETWHRRRGRLMTLSGYASSGGVRRAIAETAESVFVDQFTRDQQQMARRVFLRLTELGDDEAMVQDSRRRVDFDELATDPSETETMRGLVQRLSDARLVTTSEHSVEVAHEALIRAWPRLRGWLDENRQDLRTHRRITEGAREWAARDHDPEMLYRGARLAEAEDWRKHHAPELNPLEREFLDASIARREGEAEEREAQRRRELEAAEKLVAAERSHAAQLGRRATYLGAAVLAALLMAGAALFFGAQARQSALSALQERRIATSRELAAAAISNLTVDPERSILLALEAISTTRSVDQTVMPEAVQALHRSLVSSPLRMTLSGHEGAVFSASYSPDGKRLATIGADGTVIVWNPADGTQLLRVPGSTTPGTQLTTQRIAYSPDGTKLLTCESSTVVLLEANTGAVLGTLTGLGAEVSALSFSRDARLIAAGDVNGVVMVWDARSHAALLKLEAHTIAPESVTFSPDGGLLITAAGDAAMKVWDVRSGGLVRAYTDFTGVVGPAAFSPDGTELAFTTEDGLHIWRLNLQTQNGTAIMENEEQLIIPGSGSVAWSPDGTLVATSAPTAVWDRSTGRQVLNLIGHTDWVMGMAFGPDGHQLATTSLDGTVKIWDVGRGQETLSVSVPTASFGTRLAIDPVQNEFATNGGDGSASLWDASNGKLRLRVAGQTQSVLAVAYSRDGMRFATGSLDGSVVIWDAASGAEQLRIAAHPPGVRDLAFSPDGTLLATGGFDGAARVWDAKNGRQVHEFAAGNQGLVVGVAFSPDGRQLATSSTDGTVIIWDAATGKNLFRLDGHAGTVPDLTYSPDGSRLATAGKDGLVILWNPATGKQVLQLKGHRGEIQTVVFSADGELIGTGGSDDTARLWNAKTGEELLRLPGSQAGINGVGFLTQGAQPQFLVASNDGVVRAFLLRLEDVLALARRRVTRPLSPEECSEFLHAAECPPSE